MLVTAASSEIRMRLKLKASKPPRGQVKRKPRGTRKPNQHAPDTKRSFDIWLSRSSKSAQIVMPILAVLGFWYTVLPLYSKAVLEEQAAKTQLELISQKQELSTLEALIAEKQESADELIRNIAREEEKSSALQEEINDLSIKRLAAERTARLAIQNSERRYEEMRASVISSALKDANLCLANIVNWSSFYMVALRSHTRDASPAIMGERYENLNEIEQCIDNKIINGYGIPQLSPRNLEVIETIVAKHRPRLTAQLARLDGLFSDERDAYLSAEIVLNEYEAKLKKHTRSLSTREQLAETKIAVRASVDFSMGHLDRNRSLQSDAKAVLITHKEKIKSDLSALKWIE